MSGSIIVSEYSSSFKPQSSNTQTITASTTITTKTAKQQQADFGMNSANIQVKDDEYVDDDGSSENAMNNEQNSNNKNGNGVSSAESMNAVSESHDQTMTIMNELKNKPIEMPSVTHAVMPPEPVVQQQLEQQTKSFISNEDLEEQESNLSQSEMENSVTSANEMPQNTEKPAFMPSTTKAVMKEGDNIIPGIVPESTGEVMQNDVVTPSIMTTTPSIKETKKETKKKEIISNTNILATTSISSTTSKAPIVALIAPKVAPVVVVANEVKKEDVSMDQVMNDGMEMGNIPKNSNYLANSVEPAGFMDAPTAKEDANFESQMNATPQKSIDMMSTIAK